MKIIVSSGKKKEIRKINDDIFLLNLPEKLKFLSVHILKSFLKKFCSFGAFELYSADNLNHDICQKLKKQFEFSTKKPADCFFSHIGNIAKAINSGDGLSVLIVSNKPDERIFKLCEKINSYCKILLLSTNDEKFYEKISDSCLEKYGLIITLKEYGEVRNSDINIILNSKSNDFSSQNEFTINLSEKNIFAKKLLYDIVPNNYGDFSNVEIKKCQFLPSKCENFNLIWKNSQKSVDKLKK